MLLYWLRSGAEKIISGNDANHQLKFKTPPYFGSLGIYITLKKGGRVRGCCGAFHHYSDDIGATLLRYLACAMKEDLRHEPVELSELDELRFILTITSQPFAVNDYQSVDFSRYGIFFTCDRDERILFVPEELKTLSYLNSHVRGKTCQAFAFEAVTLAE